MRNNLAGLVEYFTHGDLVDMKNLSYFHFVFVWSRKDWLACQDLAFRRRDFGECDEHKSVKTPQPACRGEF